MRDWDSSDLPRPMAADSQCLLARRWAGFPLGVPLHPCLVCSNPCFFNCSSSHNVVSRPLTFFRSLFSGYTSGQPLRKKMVATAKHPNIQKYLSRDCVRYSVGFWHTEVNKAVKQNLCPYETYILRVFTGAEITAPNHYPTGVWNKGLMSWTSRLGAVKELRWGFYTKTSNDVSNIYLIALLVFIPSDRCLLWIKKIILTSNELDQFICRHKTRL